MFIFIMVFTIAAFAILGGLMNVFSNHGYAKALAQEKTLEEMYRDLTHLHNRVNTLEKLATEPDEILGREINKL